jgi:hypothetical protein
MDCIWNSTLGIDINLQENTQDNDYLRMTDEALLSFVHLKFPLQLTGKFLLNLTGIFLKGYFEFNFYLVLLSEFRRLILYIHLFKSSINNKLNDYFGIRYVDALYWIREKTLSFISDQSHQKVIITLSFHYFRIIL